MKLAIVIAAALAASAAYAENRVENGAAVFKKCTACHNVERSENRVGPHLVGILGRPAGSLPGYSNYSDVMRAAGEKGLRWDEENLTEFLSSPKKYLPGTRMAFAGLKEPQDVRDLILFLGTR
jgi:Cytochrome c2